MFLKMPGSLQGTKKYWEIIIEREGLTKVLKETPDLTLETYKKFTIDLEEPQVCNTFHTFLDSQVPRPS